MRLYDSDVPANVQLMYEFVNRLLASGPYQCTLGTDDFRCEGGRIEDGQLILVTKDAGRSLPVAKVRVSPGGIIEVELVVPEGAAGSTVSLTPLTEDSRKLETAEWPELNWQLKANDLEALAARMNGQTAEVRVDDEDPLELVIEVGGVRIKIGYHALMERLTVSELPASV